MYAGYAGLMLCRTAVTVASPEMVDDRALGLTEAGFGELLAYGAGGALAGKLVTGGAADVVGWAAVFTCVFANFALGQRQSFLFGEERVIKIAADTTSSTARGRA